MARRFSGQHLRAMRTAAGISRTRLAAAVHRCEHTVYLWERGRVTPSANALAQVADALDCRPDDLFAEEACA